MQLLQVALVFALLIIAVEGTSDHGHHSVRSRRSEDAVTHEQELSTTASLYSTLAHHHGYPYGWNLPLNGLTHEVHPVVHTKKHGHEHDKDKMSDEEHCHRHWHLPCVDHVTDVDDAFDGLE